jgi:hypothetical protein
VDSRAPIPAQEEGRAAGTASPTGAAAAVDPPAEAEWCRSVAERADGVAVRRRTAGERGGAAFGTEGLVPESAAGAVADSNFLSAT